MVVRGGPGSPFVRRDSLLCASRAGPDLFSGASGCGRLPWALVNVSAGADCGRAVLAGLAQCVVSPSCSDARGRPTACPARRSTSRRGRAQRRHARAQVRPARRYPCSQPLRQKGQVEQEGPRTWLPQGTSKARSPRCRRRGARCAPSNYVCGPRRCSNRARTSTGSNALAGSTSKRSPTRSGATMRKSGRGTRGPARGFTGACTRAGSCGRPRARGARLRRRNGRGRVRRGAAQRRRVQGRGARTRRPTTRQNPHRTLSPAH